MSSLIFLGFSVILFIISYGIMFTIAPMILGSVFTVMENNLTNGSMTQEWIDMYNQTKETTQYLIPLIPSIGIFILVIKVLMVASARGRD
uniref:ORF9 n=1 Tax=Nitrosopumilaceae spindle-shaped virus TaxID=3065433 RepID=A0AAT9JAU4_9VIRU